MTATIRLRVNPSGGGEYVIYADPEDAETPWVGQTAEGTYLGWLPEREVAHWPEVELAIPAPP